MSKVIQSPVKRFPGSVTLYDPMGMPQALALENALRKANELQGENASLSRTEYQAALLPGIMACVEKWDLQGVGNPPAPFPATPRAESANLIDWLIQEISVVYLGSGEVQDPNG